MTEMVECDGCGEYYPEDEMGKHEGDLFDDGWYCPTCLMELEADDEDED